MSSIPLSRGQVENAGELDFDARRRPAEPATITAHVQFSGIHFEVCFSGQVDQLPALAKRLVALGAEPVSAAPTTPAPIPNGKAKAERVDPIYKPDGSACCPVHKRTLSDGAHGLYCSAKATADQVADKKGYCGLRFTED